MSQSIPLVDLKAQYENIRPEIDGAIQRILDNTSFILGHEVSTFEENFAAFCHADYCVGVSSGTSALVLSLRALDIGPGDEVITVAHTFIATAEAISTVGATPVFVDIDPGSYNMNPAQLEAALTPATRAIIPVHLYGQPANIPAIQQIAQAHNLTVIEDAAQAHGATWADKATGTLADIACFSFYPGKNLGAYGDAGAVVTNNPQIADNIRMLRDHGRTSKYLHDRKGYGERIDAMQAAILDAKLAHLTDWTNARRRLAARYTEMLADCELTLPWVAPEANPVWHLYVIRTPQRDEMLSHLQENGIGAGIHYPIPLHLQPAYADLGYDKGDLPVTEEVAKSCLSLPIYPELNETQQDYVVSKVKEFLHISLCPQVKSTFR